MTEFHIPTPPWTTLGKKLESTIRKALFDYKMLEGVSKVAIALSGGKDSLTLAYMLKAINGRGFAPFDLVAIHVNGEFSCGAGVQLSFLEEVCRQLEIPLIVKQSTQKLETLECYKCSRERRTLIFEAAKQVGAFTVAFGHTLDDNAETILMNLLHKAEFAGNLPKLTMQAYGVTLIRPLIYVNEADIKNFAKQNGFGRITCQCPVGQKSMRSKVDQLLEELEVIFPNARENIAQAGLTYGSQKAAIP
jgi:tRNA 2-thiocytidine biosynthesis protein TtcA